LFRLAADTVIAIHVGFVLFVVIGGLLVLRWPWMVWLHVPAAVWGVFIEYAGWVCPLTPLENYLRERGGVTTYSGDFIEHYVFQLLYPAQLTRGMQMFLGSVALAVNACIYWRLFRTRRRRV
jgi:hypothetical protein